MSLARETASSVYRTLGKYCQEANPDGKWQWQCAMLNGTRLPVAASFREGFLSFSYCAEASVESSSMLGRAIAANAALHRSVKLVFDAARCVLELRSDIAVLDEAQLQARLPWILDGFHHGAPALESIRANCPPSPEPEAAKATEKLEPLPEIMRDSGWPFTERGPGEIAVDLESEAAPPALVRMEQGGITASVELARWDGVDGAVAEALPSYLLSVSRSLRLVRACRLHSGPQLIFAFQVGLPPSPTREELTHALAALSVAHRSCVREASLLLDEATARCYLAARPSPSHPEFTDRMIRRIDHGNSSRN